MKKQSDYKQQILTPAVVNALISNAEALYSPLIHIPSGTGRIDGGNTEPTSLALQAAFSSNTALTATATLPSINTDITFGAPQIDLAFPKGALTAAGLHEFNPKHHRDQLATYQTTLALAARQQQANPGTPIFCFITEDQKQLLEWLKSDAAESVNLAKDDIIIITAKYSDDLLWAIEETLHTTGPAAIIAHFNTLDSLAAQRLAITSRTKGVPGFLVCNHPIEGPIHAETRWTLQQAVSPESQKPHSQLTANYIKIDPENKQSWAIRWNSANNRFSASLISNESSVATLH